jgi:hypothetical protein
VRLPPTWKISIPVSIEIESNCVDRNAEPSMNCTLRGIIIDLSEESENADDSIGHFN